MEKNGASRAQRQTGQFRSPGLTGNTPAPKQGERSFTCSANFVYENEGIAQDHVERIAGGKMLQLHHVGGMQSTGSTVQGYLYHCLSVLLLLQLT